jgi:hypothetical protein
MTGLDGWQAGHELGCAACVFVTTDACDEPHCQIAMELALFGETLTATACPRSIQEQAA